LREDSTIEAKDPAELNARDPRNICDVELMVVSHKGSDFNIDVDNGIFSFIAALLQPRSTGTVRLTSTDAKVQPAVDPGYLSDPADYLVLRKAVLLSKRIGETMRKEGYQLTDYSVPTSESKEDLDVFIRKNARTSYHYSSTCRMAPENDVCPGVVDDKLRVHGVKGLRIADASIFPDILANHLQAPVVMVAEKCADLINETWAQ
jgi:choline dehydrogenase-like flavoprotein